MKITKANYFRVAYRNGHFTKRHDTMGDAIAHAILLRANPGIVKIYEGGFWIEHIITSRSIEQCVVSIAEAEAIGMI